MVSKIILRSIVGVISLVASFSFRVSISAAADVPAPPTSGPSVAGNFFINGYSPTQNPKYTNMQIVSDGSVSKSETMWYKNPVNIKQAFQTKFYIYMAGAADGLTFTLQGQGLNAIGTAGESLGVYGTIHDTNQYSNFIKNALSIEFDPYVNADHSDYQVVKDLGAKAHIAYAYPEERSSERVGGILFGRNQYYLKHYSPKAVSLDDAKWHAVTIRWTPNNATGQGTIDTTFDNVSIGTQSVPLSRFGTSNVYWGFTGSTGKEAMVAAVAYTEVIQQPGVQTTVRNVTKGETTFSDSINAKDGDTIEYQVQVSNSSVNGLGNSWKNVQITDDLPPGIQTLDGQRKVTFSIGDIGVDSPPITKTFKAKVVGNQTASLTNAVVATGTNYYAVPINVVSNDAVVNVQMVNLNVPISLKMNNQIFNKTYAGGANTGNTALSDVAVGDKIQYQVQLANSVANGQLRNGTYTIAMPTGLTIDSVKMANRVLTANEGYSVVTTNGVKSIKISGITVSGVSTIPLTIDATVQSIAGNHDFKSQPVFQGGNPDGSIFSQSGGPISLSFTENTIAFVPQNIDFGAHLFTNVNQLVDRTNPPSSPIVQVKDGRRTKSALNVYVSQDNPFHLVGNDGVTLPSQLRFYHDGRFDTLSKNAVKLLTTKDGESLMPIVWGASDGIRFYSNGNNFMPGNYQTSITWTVVNGY